MRVWVMHERTQIKLSATDRAALKAVVANRNSPQKHVGRAEIVLLTAAGHGTAEIMRRTGKAKTVIWRWQERATAPNRALPMKKGRAATITHDYKRHGTTTLFAAFDVLEGKIIGQCMKRHRHQEFIRFLNLIDAR